MSPYEEWGHRAASRPDQRQQAGGCVALSSPILLETSCGRCASAEPSDAAAINMRQRV